MLRNITLGALLGVLLGAGASILPGLLAGVAATPLPGLRLGIVFWTATMAAIGGFLGWMGGWILLQSGDAPKMRVSLPLTGPVLATFACLLTGERFLLPVVSSLVLGWTVGRLVRRPAATPAA